MPELPEVETVVRTLEHQLGHRTIVAVKVLWPKIIDNCSVEQFSQRLFNQRIEGYDRRGKFLVFTLTDYVLVAHLRMEGKFYVYNQPTDPNKHTHVIFDLDQGQLHYNDVRKFGRFYLYPKNEALACLEKLGYEPWDENLTAKWCKGYCKNNRTPIKSQLLDQSMIAGIGNIYADEICYAVKLHPLTPACVLSLEKWDEIINATRAILSKAIQAGGTTIRSYTSSLGVTGLFQLSLAAHGRTDECDKCGSTIIKTRVGGRGTYYCPCCQARKPLTIAITGTIGSGKSKVTSLLAEKKIKTISCDEINSHLLDQKETIEGLAHIFNVDAEIVDRSYITAQIFSNDELKKKVESYLHQRIYQRIVEFEQENQKEELLVIEVPLLYEVNWDQYFDINVVVVASKETIIKRLKKNRKMTLEQIEERYNKQMSVDEKINRSDAIIYNDGTIKELKENIKVFLKQVKQINQWKEK